EVPLDRAKDVAIGSFRLSPFGGEERRRAAHEVDRARRIEEDPELDQTKDQEEKDREDDGELNERLPTIRALPRHGEAKDGRPRSRGRWYCRLSNGDPDSTAEDCSRTRPRTAERPVARLLP